MGIPQGYMATEFAPCKGPKAGIRRLSSRLGRPLVDWRDRAGMMPQ